VAILLDLHPDHLARSGHDPAASVGGASRHREQWVAGGAQPASPETSPPTRSWDGSSTSTIMTTPGNTSSTHRAQAQYPWAQGIEASPGRPDCHHPRVSGHPPGNLLSEPVKARHEMTHRPFLNGPSGEETCGMNLLLTDLRLEGFTPKSGLAVGWPENSGPRQSGRGSLPGWPTWWGGRGRGGRSKQ